MPTWLQIGLVGKAHGLRGHFFVSRREDILPVPVGTEVFLGEPPPGKGVVLETSKMQGRRPLAKFQGIDNREAVDEIIGMSIWVDRKRFDIRDEQEYFWSDLIGRHVYDCDKNLLGEIIDVQNYGASDIVTIQRSNSQSLDLPLVEIYFDMSFTSSDHALNLIVSASLFEDLWRD